MAFTEDQMQRMLTAVMQSARRPGSFTTCSSRYKEERDPVKVEEFIATVSCFKDVEHRTEADAIKGFPLLLDDDARSWWQGVKSEANTWQDVISLLRNAFAPTKPAYRIYSEIFESKQRAKEPTDNFICKKRALFAQLPSPRPSETMMLDLIYGLLHISIRDGVPREKVVTFQDLIEHARSIEHSMAEKQQYNDKTELKKRCSYCTHIGHTIAECRKKQKAESDAVK
ncbi:activity-regulated cytoskeleton associated protein 2-like [Eupeodes corollae]|uniref:activity-regulated cytoskeleton associated protein 2-like n=1 Tax=Eupeodes corollae TaxID=290404 RepID=UPI002492CDB2|nr:activity-regulated cytoskeleton associated protein 2-like [Eupeodes corollae]